MRRRSRPSTYRALTLEEMITLRGLLYVVPFWVLLVALSLAQHPKGTGIPYLWQEGGVGTRRKEGKGHQWSLRGGSAPRLPEQNALVLRKRRRIISLVLKGVRKKAMRDRRFHTPWNVKGWMHQPVNLEY